MAQEQIDYDKQFREEMERAQALSLESLELEKFEKEKKKRIQEKNNQVSRASSMTETDSGFTKYERQAKSRPRPGTNPGSLNMSLIAPPPRKNSSPSTDSPDLISFVNPPTSTNPIIEFCNLQNYNNKPSFASSTSVMPHFSFNRPQLSVSPQFPQSSSFSSPQQNWYNNRSLPIISSNNGSFVGSSPTSSSSAGNVSTPGGLFRPPAFTPPPQASQAPALPPKNQQRRPPPLLALPSSKSVNNKVIKKNPNLIDLAPSASSLLEDKNSVRVSILQEFDPILSEAEYESNLRTISPDCSGDDCVSVCDSVYDEYDPYDFIYTGSGSNSLSDPLYAAVVKSELAPLSPAPPVPPRAQMSTLTRNNSRNIKDKLNLLDNISKTDQKSNQFKDSDLKAFYKMVYSIRSQYRYNDPNTNMGLVISPMVNYQYREGTSIKLCVYPDFQGADIDKPINFTCDVNSSVEHVTLQITIELEAPSRDKYTLKVWGCNEYLVPTTFLSDYEYVHNCIKLEEDVVLTLIPDSKVDKSFARTLQDDTRDSHLTFEDVIPSDNVLHISHDNLAIVLETVEKEMKKLEDSALQIQNCNNPNSMPALQPAKVIQSLKCVVNLLGSLCTLEIMEAADNLHQVCKDFIPKHEHVSFSQSVSNSCNKIRLAIQNLVEMYSQAFNVDFEVKKLSPTEPPKRVSEISDSVLVRVCAIYRPNNEWRHDSYMVAAQIYHGIRPIGHPVLSQPCEKTERDQLWPARIIFDHWFQIDDVPISSLARESRLVLVIYGRTLITPDANDNSNQPKYKQQEIGWTSVQFFDYEGLMIQGNMVLSVWPKESSFLHGPAPAPGTNPLPDHPLIDIQVANLSRVEFDPISEELISNVSRGDFNSLDQQTQQILKDCCEQDMLHKLPTELREVLWEKRHYLYQIPQALPKVLLAAHSWDSTCLPDLHGMLRIWSALQPIEALQLLLPTFPDMEVRKYAVRRIHHMGSDSLIDYIPQLVVALRLETYENSPLAMFLLDKALRSPRFAHHLFWLLSHTLPGDSPQNSSELGENSRDDIDINEVRYHRRMKLMIRALLAICGEALRTCFLSQQLLVKDLNEIADGVKTTKESHRLTVLLNGLEGLNSSLGDNPTSLPLSPTLRVAGVEVRSSFYFNSNTLPLKINFVAPDNSIIPAIYKVGDDLQQDMLTLQVVRLMDKLWLKEGLDLKMVSFVCVPTGKKKGMIEMVANAETLRKIQVEHGLTGSFKDKPIAEWLAKYNASELEYGRAVENFTASCAGYCVVTYILGICDRHNDNIMLKTSGHLFHIDFGKFLGDAQMFGNFKRDRAPFVLTSDMAYVINGGDRPTEKFHKFVDLCCQAFNIIRNNGNLFLYLFTLMASTGVCGMTLESVSYLHNALLPTMSNPEAAAYFARLIESSMKNWFTQFNFFLHNLAQLKFSTDHNEGSLLSFVPKTYSLNTDGRLVHVQVVNYRKRYDPDKYYVYVLRVYRADSKSHMEIQRTYKEFCELHQKLCIYFPLAKLHSLSTGLHVGRSNIKQVAEKRYREVSLFITSLFKCADEIAHSDLVYTFFHPLLRDQQYLEDFSKKVKDRKTDVRSQVGRLKGQLKLSFQFSKGVFSVMVYHCRDLPLLGNGQAPSTYVKVYLLPDSSKTTKRKTKVVKRSCHPFFVEMLEYRMALEIIKERTLQATVWNYDPLQENEFLGGVELELHNFNLTKENAEWYSLVNLSR